MVSASKILIPQRYLHVTGSFSLIQHDPIVLSFTSNLSGKRLNMLQPKQPQISVLSIQEL